MGRTSLKARRVGLVSDTGCGISKKRRDHWEMRFTAALFCRWSPARNEKRSERLVLVFSSKSAALSISLHHHEHTLAPSRLPAAGSLPVHDQHSRPQTKHSDGHVWCICKCVLCLIGAAGCEGNINTAIKLIQIALAIPYNILHGPL